MDRFRWFAATMLALGVGAATALFAVVHGVLLQPLSVPNPGQVVLLGEAASQIPGFGKFAYFDTPSAYLAWGRDGVDFSALTALQGDTFTLAGGGSPQELHGARVTAGFFDVMQVRPELGRLFQPADETDTTHPMVITDALWRRDFGANPAMIGAVIGPPGEQARVIGVLPASFRVAGGELGPMLKGEPTQYFKTLHFDPKDGGYLSAVWSNFNYTVLGRLRPGVAPRSAQAHLDAILARLAAAAPDGVPNARLTGLVTPARDYATADVRAGLWLLLAGVAAVLLIVGVNLGGLWTSRIAARRREWAIRAALGATPGRLAGAVLREGLTLGLAGGGLGVAAAAAGLRGLLAAAPANLPRLDEISFPAVVAGCGILAAALAGGLSALAPALRMWREARRPQAALSAAGPAATTDRAGRDARGALLAVQAALAMLLVCVAGLLAVSLFRLMTRPAGFAARGGITANVVLNAYSPPQREAVLRLLPPALLALPGVTAAGLTSHLPLQGETWVDDAALPGKTYLPGHRPLVNVRFISPGYLRAMGIALLAGRDLRESDRPPGWPPKDDAAQDAMATTVILSRSTTRLLWPGAAPGEVVGRRMLLDSTTAFVIGVTADALDGDLTGAAPSVLYTGYWEYPPRTAQIVVRSSLPPAALAAPMRQAIWKLAPAAPVPTVQPLGELRALAVASQRLQAVLLLWFAALGLGLTAMGVYALVVNDAGLRAREFAIRRSLGADPARVVRLLLRDALRPVGLGALAGLLAALAAGRVLRSLVFHVSPAAPGLLAAAVTAVLAAAVLACAAPARRASRADPWPALRGQ